SAFTTPNPKDLADAYGIVLPGVGSFRAGMENLENRGLREALTVHVLEKGKPFLGICLGMQLTAEIAEENGITSGLGWIKGRCTRIRSGELRVPHIGWNDVIPQSTAAIYSDDPTERTFYFVHSYVLRPKDERAIGGRCSYGEEFAASIEWRNIV